MNVPINRHVGLLVLFTAVAGCVPHASGQAEAKPRRLLVRVKRDADPDLVRQVVERHGARLRRQHRESRISTLNIEAAVPGVEESLRSTGLFRYVEPDRYAEPARTPNDNLYQSEWHLSAVQAPAAWDVTTGASGTLIAVIDSGVDGTHPDLASRLVPGWSFLKSSQDTSDTMGHGTAVAGVLGAVSDNGQGVSGMTWMNPIMPLGVVDSQDRAAYSDMIAAIHYAADHGARVINISLGGKDASQAMQDAVDYAWAKGVVIVASAMNQSTATPYYPAACNHVIAVSATDMYDTPASFSNYGNWITLSAPGVNILTTSRGSGYGYWSGTSFSSPLTAGVAALMLSINPNLTGADVVNILEQTADDLGVQGYDQYYGWGRVNAARAVERARALLGQQPAAAPAAAAPPLARNSGAAEPVRTPGSRR